MMNATLLASLKIGEAIAYGAGSPMKIQFPLAQDPAKWSPKFVAQRVEQYQRILSQIFPAPREVLQARQRELASIIRNLGLALPEKDTGDDPFPN